MSETAYAPYCWTIIKTAHLLDYNRDCTLGMIDDWMMHDV
jgi:hypothetical protein